MFVRPKKPNWPGDGLSKNFWNRFWVAYFALNFSHNTSFQQVKQELTAEKNFERSDNIPHFFQVKGSSKVNRKKVGKSKQANVALDDITTPPQFYG